MDPLLQALGLLLLHMVQNKHVTMSCTAPSMKPCYGGQLCCLRLKEFWLVGLSINGPCILRRLVNNQASGQCCRQSSNALLSAGHAG